MDCSTPGFPVPELAQTHVHWVGDAIQPSHPLSPLLLPSIFPSIRVFSNEPALRIRWPNYCSFSFNISLSNEHSGLISFRMDRLDLLAVQFSSVPSLSRVQLFSTPWTAARHWIISSSVIPFFSCLRSFPASGSFSVSQFFTSGGQSTGVSASASIFLMNIQGWFLLGLTGLISVESKGLSRVFSNTTVQKHQFFSIQLSLWSNSHIHTWQLAKS